jgi:hypothetical protein
MTTTSPRMPGEMIPGGARRRSKRPKREDREVVVIMSAGLAEVAPEGSEGGLKEQLAAEGRPEHANVTALGSGPSCVPSTMVKLAVWPAVTVCAPDVELMVKSVTASASADDTPPPGAGLKTVMESMAAVARLVAGIVAMSEKPLLKVEDTLAPFTCTIAVFAKFVPVTVKDKAGLPAMTPAGESEVSVGTGFALVTWSVRKFDGPPPGAGFDTEMEREPTAARRLAGRATVREVALTEDGVKAAVFTCTDAPFTKFMPITVRLSPAVPARTLVCDRDEIMGTGFRTGSKRVFDVPPPGAGFKTVMESEPAEARRVAGIATVREVALTEEGVRVVVFT